MKRYLSLAIVAFSLFSLSNAYAYSGRDPVYAHGTVYRVIDGDTYQVNIDKDAYDKMKIATNGQSKRLRHMIDKYQSIRVRLASVDTQESVHPDKSKNTAEGKSVSDEIKSLIQGKESDLMCYDFGTYGRAICSIKIHSNEGDFDLGAYLIKKGYSPYVTSWGKNPFYDEEYRNLSQ